MNVWFAASIATSVTLLPCAAMCLRGTAQRRLVGLDMTSVIITLLIVMLTIGFGRTPFIDVALTMAIMSYGGGLVYARFLEKHL